MRLHPAVSLASFCVTLACSEPPATEDADVRADASIDEDAGARDGGREDSGLEDGGGDAGGGVDGGTSRAPLRLFTIDLGDHPNAVCSDGSPGAFHMRLGSGANADRWVFWFKGGGYCYEEEACRRRATDRETVSSVGLPEMRSEGGILSDDPAENPDFHDWTHVRMSYCSSDRWAGQRMDSAFEGLFSGDPTRPFYFRGRFIVDAILATLSERRAGMPSLSDATDVILTGSSGGAHGLRSNLDRVAELLGRNGTSVRGLNDAGIDGYLEASVKATEDEILRGAYPVWQSFADASCRTVHTSEPWRCLDPNLLLTEGHFETPIFYVTDQLDPTRLFGTLGYDRGDTAAIEAFGRGLRERLAMHATGAFAPRAGDHVIVTTGRFGGPGATRIEGRSLAEAFGDWYFERPGETVLIEAP